MAQEINLNRKEESWPLTIRRGLLSSSERHSQTNHWIHQTRGKFLQVPSIQLYQHVQEPDLSLHQSVKKY